MKLTGLNIQNVLGVRAARIDIHKPIAVIAGRNFSGKSSMQEAVRMALTHETVRVGLKKDYGRLVTEGADAGLVEVGIANPGGADNTVAWFSLPDGKSTPLTEYVPPAALAYVLDAQRFASLPENERRAFLFGLMGLKADGPAVKERLLATVAPDGAKWIARSCDPKKIEATMPLLRAGFAAACEDAKGKATAAKGAWRAVTGETWGAKKSAGWKAQVPAYETAALQKDRDAVVAVEAEIESEAAALGALQGQARQADEQKQKLSGLREAAAKYARIDDKLISDRRELGEWEAKLKALPPAAGDKPQTASCPECGSVLCGTIDGGLMVYAGSDDTTDPDAETKRQQYTEARDLMARAVANGERDLAAADAAAKALRALEDAGLAEAPDAQALTDAQTRLAALRQRREALQTSIRTHEAGERAEADAKKKTEAAAEHHADVEAWTKIGDALAPDGIPGEMLAEALGPINARLAQSAADAQWLEVQIDDDMSIYTSTGAGAGVFEHRPYALLSESEKWRADAVIAEAIAHLSGLKLLVLDRFDVLDIQGREDLLAWLDILAGTGEIDTALVFGTLKALPAQLPATASGHWIESGTLGQIREVA